MLHRKSIICFGGEDWWYHHPHSKNHLMKRFARADYHFFAGLSSLVAAFYASIREDGPPPVPYHDILKISSWAEQVFTQLPQGGAAA